MLVYSIGRNRKTGRERKRHFPDKARAEGSEFWCKLAKFGIV